jgi:hypothetical protein
MKKTPFFVALDGEAIHNRYCLIQDSHGGEIYRKEGLGTQEIFRWLLERQDALETDTEKPCFVGFGTSYDCNMFFRDIGDETLTQILQTEEKDYVTWEGWKILYFPRKLLRLQATGGGTYVLYDLLSYFGSSFVKAVESFLPGSQGMRQIRAGKAARGTFRQKDLAKIKAYNLRECQLLVNLADKLKAMMDVQEIYPTKWHGPGAVADYILGKKGFNVHDDFPVLTEENTSTGLWSAWDCAYYGGRIETLILGSASRVFTYDINSAYPKASSLLPILYPPRGWIHRSKPILGKLFYAAVCRIRWDLTRIPGGCKIGPFPWRDETGRIFFPSSGEGWYWLPEILAAHRMYGERIEVLEAWEQGAEDLSRLASVIPELYEKRQRLKAQGDPSEYALKIVLNSIYGKFAQRTGRRPYFCLPWAGLITAYTRGQLLDAVRGHERSVLSFATDSVTSRVPLSLPQGRELGAWKAEEYKKYLCVMNGFYRLDAETRKAKQATRGVPTNFSWDDLVEQLNSKGTVTFKNQVFVTHSLAMHQHNKWGGKRLTFQEDSKTINPFHTTKRIFHKEKLGDWEREHSDSDPPVKVGMSYPSSLSFTPDAVASRMEGAAEIEAETEE